MKKTGFFLLSLFACIVAAAQVQVTNLKVENLTNPLGIDKPQPQLSWQLVSSQRNVMQSACEVRVSDNAAFKGNVAWSSGKINSGQSVHVHYAGAIIMQVQ
jgi:alpha-L-rhamnosidase